MTGLLELADRCAKAAEADRELDATIYLTAFGDRPYGAITGNKHQIVGVGTLSGYVETYRDSLTADDALHDDVVPRYTGSIDAALALVPEGWSVTLFIASKQHTTRCTLAGNGETVEASETIVSISRSSATALCAAALRARANEVQQP